MSAAQAFNPKLVVGLIAAGIVSFAAFLLLLTYGGALGSGRDGRAHALSVSSVGFKALVTLVGHETEALLARAEEDVLSEDLLVVTIEDGTDRAQLAELLERRNGLATLIVLPKWHTVPDQARRGWVRTVGLGAGHPAARLLGKGYEVAVAGARSRGVAIGHEYLERLKVPVPAHAQTISGPGLTPFLTIGDGRALLARLPNAPHFVLADPDILNNQALDDPARARAALALIAELNVTDAESVAFDLTMNGFGASARGGLLRLAFEPPFLAMTLALVAAALLAGLYGAGRFGPVRREERAIAFGKAALVENSAGLIRLARREARLGGAYADHVRREAAHASGAPPSLAGEELDAYLDRLTPPGRPAFSELAGGLRAAADARELLAAARSLFHWKKELLG